MKFSLSWLRDHLDGDVPLDRVLSTLNTIGLEVEGVSNRGAALGAFRIARVVEAEQHPNADRLRALKVDVGDGVLRSVVCGAPNARAGMKAVAAMPGAFIPGTGITLKAGEIRGVKSEAMLLSSREMGLGDDHSGIVDLPEDAPVGTPYFAWAGLDDPVIEISVTPNRGDALSVRGVARDLAAAGLGRLKPWNPAPVPGAYPSPLRWEIAQPEACIQVLGRAVRGVANGDSPSWLRDRLVSIGLRPINALVDITNLFTFDLGRPLHVFDVAKVHGDTLTMRLGRDGDEYLALNGKTYRPGPDDSVIADSAGVESLGGIVGGEASGCDAGTREVFVECALFDPVRVALTGRRHDVRSDARARFERGLDPAMLRPGLEAATRLILDLCGGEASEIVSAGAEPAWQRTAAMRFHRIAGLGGSSIPPDRAVASLEALGFGIVARDADGVTASVPSWRNDVASSASAYRAGGTDLVQGPGLTGERAAKAAEGVEAIEAECDLIEEVLRLEGLGAVPAVSLPVLTPLPLPSLTPRQTRSALARRVLATRGLLEGVTFGFMARDAAAAFGGVPDALRVENPIAADLDAMRPTPLATLLAAAGRNAARGFPDVALFEVGPGYADPTPEGQVTMAAGIRLGATLRHPLAPSRALDALDAKGDALAVLLALGVASAALSVSTDAPAHYHPGRSGVLRSGPKLPLARFGELHPRVLAGLGITGPAVGFEVLLDAIPEPKRRKRSAPDIPAFQPVRRDFAFLVDATVPAEGVARAARGADRALITEVTLFDRYAGERLPEGKVSLAIEVTFQPREKSLTDAELEAASRKVSDAVAKATGGVLRA